MRQNIRIYSFRRHHGLEQACICPAKNIGCPQRRRDAGVFLLWNHNSLQINPLKRPDSFRPCSLFVPFYGKQGGRNLEGIWKEFGRNLKGVWYEGAFSWFCLYFLWYAKKRCLFFVSYISLQYAIGRRDGEGCRDRELASFCLVGPSKTGSEYLFSSGCRPFRGEALSLQA